MKKAIRHIRAAFKFAILLGWSFVLLPWALLSHIVPLGRAERGAWFTLVWARGAWRILGGRAELCGGETPSGGGLLVSNHLSYLDIIVHASILKVRFAPKIEMKKWPLVGLMTGINNPVWIDRRRRELAGGALNAMCGALRGSVPLLVYPEGTNGDGGALLPFKTTCFAAAAEADAPIYPMLTRYLPAADGTPLPWVGNEGFLPHFWRVLGLKEIRCQVYIMPLVRPNRRGRKELTERLRDEMAGQYRRWNEYA